MCTVCGDNEAYVCTIADGWQYCEECAWGCNDCGNGVAVELGYGLCEDCCRALK